MAKKNVVAIRFDDDEYRALEEKAKASGKSVAAYARECVVGSSDVSLLQLRIMLSEMRNLLGNIFLGERLVAGRMDEMFRSISTRMTEKDSSRLTSEQKAEVEARTERQLEICVSNAVEKVAQSYGGDGQDPLRLDDFGRSLDSML